MGRVILLSKMLVKSHFFISRLTVFNETFCDLKGKHFLCLLWHEVLQGRCAVDVASACVKVVTMLSSYTTFTFSADNCCFQNKNWVLYATFCLLVNKQGGPEKVTIKYLEKGHTYMRLDSIHGSIGCKMKKIPDTLDWNDLVELIDGSTKRTKCLTIHVPDMYSFTDIHGNVAHNSFPRLDKIKAVQFRQGSNNLFVKCYLDAEFEEKECLRVCRKKA